MKYSVTAIITNDNGTTETINAKGFYYQGKKHTVIVGNINTGDTVRRKHLTEDVELIIKRN